MSTRASAGGKKLQPSTPPPNFKLWFEALEHLLRLHMDCHQQLLECVVRKRAAIRAADIKIIAEVSQREHGIAKQLTDGEAKRLELIGRFTSVLEPNAARPLTVTQIAAAAPEPQQARLLALAAQLRELVSQVKAESSVVRAAADALSRHMSGVVQTVHSALSRARVYGHRGTITLGSTVSSVVDLKS